MNLQKLKKNYSTPDSPSVIAVTGQMAAGKNYVCSQLETLGWKAIDCDLLVHKAINQATPQIIEAFGEIAEQKNIRLLNDDNTINRRELGKLVFANPDLLKTQEGIVYPIITDMVLDFCNQNPHSIINATVLFKTPELLNKCDYVIFVKAPLLKRLKRARKRDKMPYRQILNRFKSQKNLEKLYKNTKKTIKFLYN